MMQQTPQAVLLIGHGTRIPEGIADIEAFAAAVAARVHQRFAAGRSSGPAPSIGLAFLELAKPDLAGELSRMAETGVRRIVMAPLFLFAAGHLNEDIPAIIQPVQNKYNLTTDMLQPYGNEIAFADVTAARIHTALTTQTSDAILLVGRGNHDASAQADFLAFAEAVQARVPNLPFTTGYLAGSGRRWQEALDGLYAAGKRRILLQPYLWFRGWLTMHLLEWVSEWQTTHPGAAICIGSPLGNDPLLQRVVSDRIISALQYPL